MTVVDHQIQSDYNKRINKVFSFIDENLDSALSLETVSKIAYFSPFHFHRVFKIITGETLNDYVTRRRIEKAASILIHKRNISITELSLQNGFNNNSSFTRIFKRFYGMSPTAFRKENPTKYSKISQVESKNGQAYPSFEDYFCNITNLKRWIEMNAKIKIKEISKLELAYVSCIGPMQLENSYAKLIKWATPKGLLNTPSTKMVTIYHDSFKITAAEKVRMSACLILKEPTEVNDEIGITTIDKGKFIVGRFEIQLNEFEKSWSGLFIWMDENGYKKADRNPFEIYHNNFRAHSERKCIVEMYIPIE